MGGVLAMVAHLFYEVEKVSRQNGLRGEALQLVRESDARPMLNQLHDYLLTIREQVLPKSEAGQAITYTLQNWAALTRYCSDGGLSIDNNATERSLRSFAVDRNNWTFFGSDNGGKAAAVLRSFVSSCEIVRIDPFAWFCDVLSRIAEHPITRLGDLLPHAGLRHPGNPPPSFPLSGSHPLSRQRGSSGAYVDPAKNQCRPRQDNVFRRFGGNKSLESGETRISD